MQRIAMRCSRYRHKHLATTGHLFERRYKAKLVEIDAHVFALLRYIHLNPVAAGMVANVDDYPWSSQHAYLGKESIPWLTTDAVLGLFGSTLITARAAYARWMAQEIHASESRLWDDTHLDDSRVLGGDTFLAALPPIQITPRSKTTLCLSWWVSAAPSMVSVSRACNRHRDRRD
jgi:putative transposase